MSPAPARLAACFALGAILGTLLDGIHAYGDVLSYPHPAFGRWAWFVPLEFGLLGALACVVVPLLEQRRANAAPPSVPAALAELALFTCLYLATALLDGDAAPFLAAGLGALAVARLALGCGGDLPYVLLAAVLGPAGEAILSAAGAFSYAHPDLIGIPLWLPALWANAGFLIRRLMMLLASPRRRAVGHS
jgi:hypothetical protein